VLVYGLALHLAGGACGGRALQVLRGPGLGLLHRLLGGMQGRIGPKGMGLGAALRAAGHIGHVHRRPAQAHQGHAGNGGHHVLPQLEPGQRHHGQLPKPQPA
jgi:hypothetical protein